jgi:hypothetical protein
MRRFAICEEKGSGVDKVILAIEAHQLPAPDFRAGIKRFSVVLLAPRRFEDMDRDDRIRACYQHCCLCYVLHGKMTNQSVRERFKRPEAKAESASRVIRDRPSNFPSNNARHFAFYADTATEWEALRCQSGILAREAGGREKLMGNPEWTRADPAFAGHGRGGAEKGSSSNWIETLRALRRERGTTFVFLSSFCQIFSVISALCGLRASAGNKFRSSATGNSCAPKGQTMSAQRNALGLAIHPHPKP